MNGMHQAYRGEWRTVRDKALASDLLMKANRSFGALARANEADVQAKLDVKDEWGSWDRAYSDPVGHKRIQGIAAAADEAQAVSFRDYYEPACAAAIALILTPAPDLDGVKLKIALIEEHELDNDTNMPRDPMELVQEDIARLTGNLSASPHRRWLVERTALMERLNGDGDIHQEEQDAGARRLNELDALVLNTAPRSLDDLFVKLLLVSMVASQGETVVEEDAARIVSEAYAFHAVDAPACPGWSEGSIN